MIEPLVVTPVFHKCGDICSQTEKLRVAEEKNGIT